MTNDPFILISLLLFGHFLADYPLQGDFLAKAKNRKNPIAGVPWYHGLIAHSAIHGGCVGVITGSVWIGVAEAVVHALIDDAKCSNRISYNVDQLLHVLFKVAWMLTVVYS